MAQVVKYRLDYADELETEWRADILQEGYAGAVIPVKMGGNPVEIEMRDIDDPFTPVCHTEATVSLLSEGLGQYDEFKTADVYEYTLRIERAGVLYWQGTLLTEPFTEAFESTPYDVELKFSDGLSELIWERYDVAGALQGGFETVIDIMVKCFNKLPITRDIREIINMFEDSMNDADTEGLLEQLSIFEQAYWEVDSSDDKIKGRPCLDVLNFIMYALKSRLIVSDDKYYIISISEMKTVGVVKYVDYDSTGLVTGNATIALSKAVTGKSTLLPSKLAHLAGASIDINKQYQEVEFRYTSKNITTLDNSILINGNFNQGFELENGSPVPLHFTRSTPVNTSLGVTPEGLHIEAVFVPFEFNDDDEIDNAPNANVLVMEESLLINTKINSNPIRAALGNFPATIDYLLSLEDSVVTQLTRETYFLQPESPIDSAITYKNLLHDTADNIEIRIKGHFDYTYTDPTIFNAAEPMVFNKWTVKLGANYYNTGNSLWSTDANSRVWHREWGDYNQDVWVDQALGIKRHSFDVIISLDNFITTATSDLEITWFIPETLRGPIIPTPSPPADTDQISAIRIVFEHMNVKYVSDASTEFSVNKVLGETGSSTLRTRRYISEVKHGDGPSAFSVMSFRLPVNNLPTASWSTRGASESLPLYEFDINDVIENLGTYRLIFNGSLYGLLEMHNLVSSIEGKKYMIKGMRFDTISNVYELKLHEVGPYSPVIAITPQFVLGIGGGFPTSEDSESDPIGIAQGGAEITSQNNTISNTEEQSYTQTSPIIGNNDASDTASDYPVG